MAAQQKEQAPSPSDQRARLADLLGDASAIFEVLDKDTSSDAKIRNELKRISSIIDQTRDDIRVLGTGDLSQEKIPRAGQELDAVVQATESATHSIMEAAEEILGADASNHDDYQAFVTERVMTIFEACSFQDITGQRVGKVVQTLETIEERINAIASTFGLSHHGDSCNDDRTDRQKSQLLNGPALSGEGVGQDDIDNLFEDAGVASQDSIDDIFGSYGGDEPTEEASQDDIDSLFD